MKKSQVLMYEVISDRYNELMVKVINGEQLTSGEREELSLLHIDVNNFKIEMLNTYSEMVNRSQSNVDRALESNDEVIKNFNIIKENFDTLHASFDKVYNKSEEQFYSYSLAENFLIENELDDQYVDFLKEVAENEPVEGYKNAAKEKLADYHFEYEGEEYYHLNDDYGVVKEGRAYDEYLEEECK
ncbi:hypothetical protein AB3Z07_04990 [Metabacillus halosaccharovorans]|uniref:hypothetical protein n=1 Tax=Metabacillus halosaccharovorans TaxID=930124 RepID=UPI0034CD4755